MPDEIILFRILSQNAIRFLVKSLHTDYTGQLVQTTHLVKKRPQIFGIIFEELYDLIQIGSAEGLQ